MLRWLLVMAITIVSNLNVYSDWSGHGNQGRLLYAANQGRWWYFAPVAFNSSKVSSWVSASGDLMSTSFSQADDSPPLAASRTFSNNDRRQIAGLSITNGSTDVFHISASLGATGGGHGWTDHIRGTFTGAGSASWESWTELDSGTGPVAWEQVKANALGLSSGGFIHESSLVFSSPPDAQARLSSNADTGATWTNAFGAIASIDTTSTSPTSNYAYASLGSDAMLVVYDDGLAADPNNTGLRYQKYTSGATWPTTSSGVTGNGTGSQDQNDWCLCRVDDTHVFCVRRASGTTFDMQMFNGSTWSGKTAPTSPASHKAGSGVFLATDGTDMWMFLIRSNADQNIIQYCKYNVAGNSWDGSWTQLEGTTSNVRGFISGYQKVSNGQIGVIYTEANGSNFDVKLTVLVLTPLASASIDVKYDLFPKTKMRPLDLATYHTEGMGL